MLRKRIVILWLIGLGVATTVMGQQQIRLIPMSARPTRSAAEQTLSDRARRYEDRGDNARALETWRALLSENAWHTGAIGGVRRNLVYLKRYEEAIEFTEGIIARARAQTSAEVRPDTPLSPFALTLNLGEIYLYQGETERAWEIWNRALTSESKSPYAVNLFVKVLQRNRLWEDAEKLIRDFRKQAKQPGFMALEMASSLRIRMQWKEATREVIAYLQEAPQGWKVAQTILARFPDDSLVYAEVRKELERAVRKQKRDVNIRRLYAGYLFKIRDFAEAYEQTVILDSLGESRGGDILTLAGYLLKEKKIALASQAFARVLNRDPAAKTRIKAELGLADCLLHLERYTEAKAAYKSFIQAHPKTSEVVEAHFRIATITLHHERRPEEALAQLNNIKKGTKKIPAAKVQLRIGDCLVWMDRIPEAIKTWQRVVKFREKIPDIKGEARLRIARAHLWLDSLDLALGAIDAVLGGDLSNPFFNDAVHYSRVLTEGGSSEALKAFAQGDLLLFCEEPNEAAEQFERVAKLAKYGRLAEWGWYLQALALRKAGNGEAAAQTLIKFTETFPKSRDVDRIIFLLGQIQEEDLQDIAAARASYERILSDFPESSYLEPARKRARALGKAL